MSLLMYTLYLCLLHYCLHHFIAIVAFVFGSYATAFQWDWKMGYGNFNVRLPLVFLSIQCGILLYAGTKPRPAEGGAYGGSSDVVAVGCACFNYLDTIACPGDGLPNLQLDQYGLIDMLCPYFFSLQDSLKCLAYTSHCAKIFCLPGEWAPQFVSGFYGLIDVLCPYSLSAQGILKCFAHTSRTGALLPARGMGAPIPYVSTGLLMCLAHTPRSLGLLRCFAHTP